MRTATMLYIALGLAVMALLALFSVAYFSGEDIGAGLSRSDGQLITAAAFIGVFIGSFVSMKMLIKSSTFSKSLYMIFVVAALLLWYEYETSMISQYVTNLMA